MTPLTFVYLYKLQMVARNTRGFVFLSDCLWSTNYTPIVMLLLPNHSTSSDTVTQKIYTSCVICQKSHRVWELLSVKPILHIVSLRKVVRGIERIHQPQQGQHPAKVLQGQHTMADTMSPDQNQHTYEDVRKTYIALLCQYRHSNLP